MAIARGNTVRYGYIYTTTCLVNGKKYIGQRRPQRRDDSSYLGSGILLTRAIKKYGKENFKKKIIVEGDFNNTLLNELERHYIQLYAAYISDKFYNIASGGNIGNDIYRNYKYQNIYQYNPKGDIINKFDNIQLASKLLNISEATILRACKLDSCCVKLNCFFTTEKSNVRKRKDNIIKNIYVKDLVKNKILKFNSVKECSIYFNNYSTSGISRLAKVKGVHNDRYILSYDNIFKKDNVTKNKKRFYKIKNRYNIIYQYNNLGELVESYKNVSVTELAEILGIKSSTLRNNIKKHSLNLKLNSYFSTKRLSKICSAKKIFLYDTSNKYIDTIEDISYSGISRKLKISVSVLLYCLKHRTLCRKLNCYITDNINFTPSVNSSTPISVTIYNKNLDKLDFNSINQAADYLNLGQEKVSLALKENYRAVRGYKVIHKGDKLRYFEDRYSICSNEVCMIFYSKSQILSYLKEKYLLNKIPDRQLDKNINGFYKGYKIFKLCR